MCNKCPKLCESRTQIVKPIIGRNILIIGEAPGATEDKVGKPFQGKCGKFLQDIFDELKIQPSITNTILCRPENNRNPTKKEIENCESNLNSLIERIMPRIIVTIGTFSTKKFLGKVKITEVEGKLHGENLIPCLHPSYYYFTGQKKEIKNKIFNALKLAKELSEK